ncbi:MAG: RNA polymerase sigma factor SigI [Clostridia bacterium]|nr:RNA polymerase sigma factor SigI [Clostridia bacterium]
MQPVSINERVEKIKNNEDEINKLVEDYKPFIASCVEKVTGRYVRYGEDDELSIALMAFVEAVKSHDSAKGNFLTFSQNVIKRRLIDYYRKEKRHTNVISLTEYYNDEDDSVVDLSAGEAIENFTREEISEYRRLELQQLKDELLAWDISFVQLAEASPKHDKTRKMYKDIVRFLLTEPELIKLIKQKKYIPIAEIEKSLDIPRKKIERARKYIIAVIIISTGDYQYIRDYLE